MVDADQESVSHRRPRARGQNEGTIYQRKSDGRWVASVSLGRVGGKRRRKELSFATRKEAQDKLHDLIELQKQGVPIAQAKETLGAFLDHWLEHTIKPNRKPKTHASYTHLVTKHIKPALGAIHLGKLRPEDVERFIADKRKSKLSPRTVQYIHAVLRASLNRAVRLEKIRRNVAELVEAPTVPKFEIMPLSPAGARAFLGAASKNRLGAIFSVGVALGLRIGEILGLRWRDIDFETKTITVRQQQQRVAKVFIYIEPKTERARKPVAMPAAVVTALKAHRKSQLRDRLLAGKKWRDTDLVFTTRHGTPLYERNVTRTFKALLKTAGVSQKTRLHDLRHTCATLLIAQGVHPRVVMETLRHSQYKLTMDTYAHVMPELQREAADAIDAALEKPEPRKA